MIVLYTLVLEFNVKKKAILLTYLKSLIFFFVFLFQNFVLKTLTYYLPIFLREITWETTELCREHFFKMLDLRIKYNTTL